MGRETTGNPGGGGRPLRPVGILRRSLSSLWFSEMITLLEEVMRLGSVFASMNRDLVSTKRPLITGVEFRNIKKLNKKEWKNK